MQILECDDNNKKDDGNVGRNNNNGSDGGTPDTTASLQCLLRMRAALLLEHPVRKQMEKWQPRVLCL
jgi:hypothetical protein